MTLEELIGSMEVTDSRKETLARALELGASDERLVELRDAPRVSRKETIVLPPHRFEGLSRGRGWCRKGRGDSAVWGERTDQGGYRVGPGRWEVGATDGFARKRTVSWDVRHVVIGGETWTIAK